MSKQHTKARVQSLVFTWNTNKETYKQSTAEACQRREMAISKLEQQAETLDELKEQLESQNEKTKEMKLELVQAQAKADHYKSIADGKNKTLKISARYH